MNREEARFSKGEELLSDEHTELYIMTERPLIGIFSDRLAVLDPGKTKSDCEFLAVEIIGELYHDWFMEQVKNSMTLEKFLGLYRGMHGPMNLFKALFPGREIDEFLSEQIAARGLETDILAEIKRDLDDTVSKRAA